MGGGSPVFEAARLGLSVIGYDTNPMARWVVERELEAVDPDELRNTGERSPPTSKPTSARLYRTDCPDCGADAHARYSLWLRHHRCPCGAEHPLLADTKVVSAGMRRHPRDVHCCPHCLTLTDAARTSPRSAAGTAGARTPPGWWPQTPPTIVGLRRRVPRSAAGHHRDAVRELIGVEYHCADCASTPGATARLQDRRRA